MEHNIQSKTGRKELPPRREPYWSRVSAGLYVGYRKPAVGDGTWIARKRTEDGRQRYHALGSIQDEDGGKAYDKAVKEAHSWARKLDQDIEVGRTVKDACRAYVQHLEQQKGAAAKQDADGRFQRLVYDHSIGRTRLDKLKTTHLRNWLNEQIPEDGDPEQVRRAKDSANRNLASLKAALNRALKDHLVESDAGWRTVTRFPQAGKRRERFLTKKERQAIIQAAPKDLAEFVRGLLLTLARPGELARANVADFDSRHGSLTLSGKTGPRTVTLSTAAVKFFRQQAKGKLPTAPLLAQADGERWNKEDWKGPFRESAKSAGLPDEIVLYHIRHAAISEAMAAGVDSFLVAKLAGTSTAMIDRHYGHLRHDTTRARLDEVSML